MFSGSDSFGASNTDAFPYGSGFGNPDAMFSQPSSYPYYNNDVSASTSNYMAFPGLYPGMSFIPQIPPQTPVPQLLALPQPTESAEQEQSGQSTYSYVDVDLSSPFIEKAKTLKPKKPKQKVVAAAREESELDEKVEPVPPKRTVNRFEIEEEKEIRRPSVVNAERQNIKNVIDCYNDNMQCGAASGAIVGGVAGAASMAICCCPSVLCRDNNKMDVVNQAAKAGAVVVGGVGAAAGGIVGIVTGLFTAPCAFFTGRSTACSTLSEKTTNTILDFMSSGSSPAKQSMRD